MKVTIELSKNNNLVTRLKVQGGQYYYDLKKIEAVLNGRVEIAQGNIDQANRTLEIAKDMQKICDNDYTKKHDETRKIIVDLAR